MSMINPNHPVSQLMDGNWHKVLVLLMIKHGIKEFLIDEEVLELLNNLENQAVIAHSKKEGLLIRVVSREEGVLLAKQAGGLPS